jgi:hypothetical protein
MVIVKIGGLFSRARLCVKRREKENEGRRCRAKKEKTG